MVIPCSPLLVIFILVAITLLLAGFFVQWLSRVRNEGSGEFDRNTVLLVGMIFVAFVSMSVFIFFVFFRTINC